MRARRGSEDRHRSTVRPIGRSTDLSRCLAFVAPRSCARFELRWSYPRNTQNRSMSREAFEGNDGCGLNCKSDGVSPSESPVIRRSETLTPINRSTEPQIFHLALRRKRPEARAPETFDRSSDFSVSVSQRLRHHARRFGRPEGQWISHSSLGRPSFRPRLLNHAYAHLLRGAGRSRPDHRGCVCVRLNQLLELSRNVA